jgi:hypothetical protein
MRWIIAWFVKGGFLDRRFQNFNQGRRAKSFALRRILIPLASMVVKPKPQYAWVRPDDFSAFKNRSFFQRAEERMRPSRCIRSAVASDRFGVLSVAETLGTSGIL